MATKANDINDLCWIQANLKAPKNQRNNFGGYNYRSCEDIMEAVKPLLKERNCTLIVGDEIVEVADRVYVKATAILRTSDGTEYTNSAYAREPQTKKGADESQITGATSSYARKYALNGLFCIDDTKDADATNDHKETPKTAENVTIETIRLRIAAAKTESELMNIYKLTPLPLMAQVKPLLSARKEAINAK